MLPFFRQWCMLMPMLYLAVAPMMETVNPTSYTPPASITVRVYRLDESGAIFMPEHLCLSGETFLGCTASSAYGGYPWVSNPVTVQIEGTATSDRYLRDVTPQEMGPAAFHANALQAQAIAARTFAYFNIQQGNTINNSTQFQVFLPRKYDTLTADQRALVDAAVQDRYYMSPESSDNPIFAQYFDDKPDATVSGGYPYLLAVPEPISSSSYGSSTVGHGHGLSQKGASRWARGNRWYNIVVIPGVPWSVAWHNPLQLLAHYYTDINVRNANAGNQVLTSNYRWNALQINNLPTQPVPAGGTHYFSLWAHNTGTGAWHDGSYPEPLHALSYRIYQGRNCIANCTGERRWQVPRDVGEGDNQWFYNVDVPFPTSVSGVVTVRFDMVQLTDLQVHVRESEASNEQIQAPRTSVDFWFAEHDLGWYTQDVRVCVHTCVSYLPTMHRNSYE